MRWEDNPNSTQEGQERVVSKFLLLPRKFNEVRCWLERVDIRERVVKQDVGGSEQWGYYRWRWVEIAFA